jgi:hypothetical protein
MFDPFRAAVQHYGEIVAPPRTRVPTTPNAATGANGTDLVRRPRNRRDGHRS